MAENIARVFADAIAPDPTRPLLTWYDDASGERTELSGATLANWVAKTANLLVDGAAVGPDDTAAVLLP
ncbi:TIGR03089 family protein, partial [Micromonospora azadirachtae]